MAEPNSKIKTIKVKNNEYCKKEVMAAEGLLLMHRQALFGTFLSIFSNTDSSQSFSKVSADNLETTEVQRIAFQALSELFPSLKQLQGMTLEDINGAIALTSILKASKTITDDHWEDSLKMKIKAKIDKQCNPVPDRKYWEPKEIIREIAPPSAPAHDLIPQVRLESAAVPDILTLPISQNRKGTSVCQKTPTPQATETPLASSPTRDCTTSSQTRSQPITEIIDLMTPSPSSVATIKSSQEEPETHNDHKYSLSATNNPPILEENRKRRSKSPLERREIGVRRYSEQMAISDIKNAVIDKFVDISDERQKEVEEVVNSDILNNPIPFEYHPNKCRSRPLTKLTNDVRTKNNFASRKSRYRKKYINRLTVLIEKSSDIESESNFAIVQHNSMAFKMLLAKYAVDPELVAEMGKLEDLIDRCN